MHHVGCRLPHPFPCRTCRTGWSEEFPDEPSFALPKSLEALVAQGKYGRKTGEGYYKWDGDKIAS